VWKLAYRKVDVEEIINICLRSKVRTACLTGGEPTAHKLGELIGQLHANNFRVHMESNGSLLPDWLPYVDHLVVSPKRERRVAAAVLRLAKELKFIVDDEFSMEEVERYRFNFSGPIFLSAANFHTNVDWPNVHKVRRLVEANPWLRLTVQLHKVLSIK
jgi:organic radical activating enzyme